MAAHEGSGSAKQALSCLKLARELGAWVYRTFAKDQKFSPGPFAPPPVPRDISTELAAQVDALRKKLAATETATATAAREAEEARRASETAQEQSRREREERALWEQLASEEEAARTRAEAELRDLQAANAENVNRLAMLTPDRRPTLTLLLPLARVLQ